MGSSSQQTSEKRIHATIAALANFGKVYALDAILLNGELAWSGPIYRASSSNPQTINTSYGDIDWYWGTEDQAASSLLNQYAEHPPYKGQAYAVLKDFDHGTSTNAYNIEIIFRAAPDQSVVTGDSAAETLDGAFTVNPICHAAELLTSPAWLGLDPDTRLVAATFQAVADEVQSEAPAGAPAGRSLSAISPLYSDAEDIRKAIVETLAQADAWLRFGLDGRIECGRWARATPESAASLTYHDLEDLPDRDDEDGAEAPNSFAVEFTDSEALHKGAKIPVDDTVALADQPLRRQTLRAPFLITYDQAQRAGEEALRRSAVSGRWSGKVRRGRAVTPSGDPLRPGDYAWVPVSRPSQTLVQRLLRIDRVVRPRDPAAPFQVSGRFDPGAAPVVGAVAAEAADVQPSEVMPPVVWRRVLALPPEQAGDIPPLRVLAAKPHNLASGMDVYYDDATDGDFPAAGQQRSFALPVSLAASFGSSADTVRIALLPVESNGANPRRDDTLLRDWSGGATEGRDDQLLLILLRKSSEVIVNQPGDQLQWIEVLSVNGAPSLVSADTYDVPVLRGRLGTSALDFTAGSFPDTWSGYEGWVIPRSSLAEIDHADLTALIATGDPAYIRLGAYSARQLYDPATADAERDRLAAAGLDLAEYEDQIDDETWAPQDSYTLPPGLDLPEIIGGELYEEI